MKVLILGSRGNLGTQLVKEFEHDYEVTAFDKEDIDITREKELREKIEKVSPAIIINAVAYNAVDKCEGDDFNYDLAHKLNVLAVEYLVNICLDMKIILVHYSSDYVFSGDTNHQSFKETDIPNPLNNYGKTKYLGEDKLIQGADRGLKYYLIRTSKLFGPLGSSPLTKPSFFDIMIDVAKEKEVVDVVDEELSCFTYTVDLARSTRDIVKEKASFGIYHLINENPVTWYEATLELFKLKGIGAKVNPVSSESFRRPALRPKYSILLNTKFRKLRPWSEALSEYLDK